MLEIKFLVSLIKLMTLKFMDMDFLAMVKIILQVVEIIITIIILL